MSRRTRRKPSSRTARSTAPEPRPIARTLDSQLIARLDGPLLFLALLVVYMFTLHPTVPGGDSGELIAVAYRWGVAHPPGYPLYTLLAKALSALVAWGTVAWRINLLSAVCDALAAALLGRLVAEWTRNRAAALVAGGLYGFSPLVWTWAVAAEVFALNNLFAAALLFVAWRWARSDDPRWAYLGAGLLGLGLSNHHTLVLLGAPLAAWMLLAGRDRLLAPKPLAILVAAGAAGLLPYLYLPIAAAADPPIVWGDPTTATGLLHHLLRRDYGTLRLGGDLPAGSFFQDQLELYVGSLAANTLWFGLILGIIGCWHGLTKPSASSDRNPRGFGAILAVCWTFYVVFFHYAANLPVNDPLFREVTARFWQQPNLIFFLWMGVGFAVLARRWSAPPRLHATVAFALAILLLAAQAGLHYRDRDESGNRYAADFGRAILDPLPPDAVLLTRGDIITNCVRYLQLCENVRPDVVVLDQNLMTKPWYIDSASRRHQELRFPGEIYNPNEPGGFTMRQWLDANRDGRPIWIYPEFKEGDNSTTGAYELWPEGLASRVVQTGGARPSFDDWNARGRQALDSLSAFPWPSVERYPPGTWERVVLDSLWQAYNRRAVHLLNEAIARGDDPAILAEVRALLEQVAAGHPATPWYVYKNLGIAYDRLRAGDPALLARRDAAWHAYLRLAPPAEPGRKAIAAALSVF